MGTLGDYAIGLTGVAISSGILLIALSQKTANALSITISPSTVAAGGSFTLSGHGGTPYGTVSATVSGDNLNVSQNGTFDSSGNLSTVQLSIPAGTPAGTATVTIRDLATNKTASATLTITTTIGLLTLSLGTYTIAQGAYMNYTASGGTPNGSTTLALLISTGVELLLSPSPVFDSNGNINGSFLIGTNVPIGNASLLLTDLTTNFSVAANFTVTT